MAVGWHILAEFYEVNPELLKKVEPVKKILEKAVEEARLTPVGSSYHQFEPEGVTGFILLEESHISIHTWPEHKYLALDVFTCSSEEQTWAAFETLKKEFNPGKVVHFYKERG